MPAPAQFVLQHFLPLQIPLSGTLSEPALQLFAHPEIAPSESHILDMALPNLILIIIFILYILVSGIYLCNHNVEIGLVSCQRSSKD